MGHLFRSEDMTYVQIYLQSDSAYEVVYELGKLGLVEFTDLNSMTSAFQRTYVQEVRRCDDMERILRFLSAQLSKIDWDKYEEVDRELATAHGPDFPVIEPRPSTKDLDELELQLQGLETEVKEMNVNEGALRKDLIQYTEMLHILAQTSTFFQEAEYRANDIAADTTEPVSHDDFGASGEEWQAEESRSALPGRAVHLSFVTGVLRREMMPAFERVLWRMSRGNVFLKYQEIDAPLEDPEKSGFVKKAAFIAFFQGIQLERKVKKVCEGFEAALYPCPDTPQGRAEAALRVQATITDLTSVLAKTDFHRLRVMAGVMANIRKWEDKVRRMKLVYHQLNMFKVDDGHRALVTEGWLPTRDLEEVQKALYVASGMGNSSHGTLLYGSDGSSGFGDIMPQAIVSVVRTKQTPPTYNRTNKFTGAFQGVVDAYGIASYKEVNPAPYTIITFPFLFAVMFGDAGHGLLMFLGALALVLLERRLSRFDGGELWSQLFGGRYLILMMGLFSIYTGLVYNDMFSKPLVFGSSTWDYELVQPNDTNFQLAPDDRDGTYVFGIDPLWQLADNKLEFLNSYKMKTAVILGVLQMLFGVLLSPVNYVYFKDRIALVHVLIPRLIFLNCIFGYLVFMILFKWATYTPPSPSLLITLINMFLNFGKPIPCNIPPANAADPIVCERLFGREGSNNSQATLQAILVVLAMLSVPWMLLAKPYILNKRHKRESRRTNSGLGYEMPIARSLQQMDATESNHLDVPVSDDAPFFESTADRMAREGSTDVLVENVPDVVHAQVAMPADAVAADAPTALIDQQVATGTGVAIGFEGHAWDFGELCVHQAIETIEFCLGCISHTASYLRLWALSLAHAELSEVLWSMVLKPGLAGKLLKGGGQFLAIYATFAFWAVLTVAILLVMEGLSAFLHTLRLHWVEFQSKFYSGQGRLFSPFSFTPPAE